MKCVLHLIKAISFLPFEKGIDSLKRKGWGNFVVPEIYCNLTMSSTTDRS